MGNRKKLMQLFSRPDPAAVAAAASSESDDDDDSYSPPTSPSTVSTAPTSPYAMSPWTQLPGLLLGGAAAQRDDSTGLLGSLVKEDGHVYSLAAAGDLLYTGTDSRNVRVWRDRREVLGGLRSGSGLVKAIVVAGDGRIYTGHQDGKVRVWRRRPESESEADGDGVRHRRVGSLPRVRDVVARSLLPRRRRQQRADDAPLRHADAVSCLSLDAAAGLLYSGSWDRTVKVWRVSDSRCLESVRAHDDAVNAVAAAGFDALLFTGSADGTVKVWRREITTTTDRGKKQGLVRTRHAVERVLRRQGDGAVTSIAVAVEARVVYVGSSDGAVTHWQWRRNGNVVRGGALRGHRMAVLCVAVAGRVVVSGSADRTVSVWRREEGARHARLAVLKGHTGPVKCLAMDEEDGGSGSGRWVVYSGSLDGSVKVWRVSADGRSSSPDLLSSATMTPARTPPPPTHHLWKGARSWSPYAAAAPEPKKRMAAA